MRREFLEVPIVHNLAILKELYDVQESGTSERRALLRKPIIITIASIAEAVLFDLYLRIRYFTREGVPNIPEEVLEEIRTKTVDEFAKYIANAQSKALLGSGKSIYEDLDELRMLRNRVHIQNSKGHFEYDEAKAFSRLRQIAAEKVLEKLLKLMEEKYTRCRARGNVAEFVLPWNDHITNN